MRFGTKQPGRSLSLHMCRSLVDLLHSMWPEFFFAVCIMLFTHLFP